ncbi:MotA/TolQ/ExbB proton channel family protein [Pseudoalteromonas aurantia]|uniref:Transporter n=1 Tax=Pseudoalteromonas aurantia TaxID=43654 RepID=A0A5S3V7G8_9GAMM|nr:MotA/TolQ/ExbB proton channel family protein [Pseudoalteromonas aurantia]TMO67799.1 transporter [Pseudoalteromonas aurantia]TMO78169.1 transporter [Pseudoalteromonas aurantia]
MNEITLYLNMLNHGVVWALLVIATFCYSKQLQLLFFMNKSEMWFSKSNYWLTALKTLLASLPLLGLLGTISGLLGTFKHMSIHNGLDMQEMVSGGIASAMFTTQLGLVLVVPGLLLQALLDKTLKLWRVEFLCAQ